MLRFADNEELLPTNIKGASGRHNCPECTRAHRMLFRSLSADLLFPDAFKVWMSHRTLETSGVATDARYLATKSERDYRVCAKALGGFFAGFRLGEIRVADLMAYQQARAINPCERRGVWRCRRGDIVRGAPKSKQGSEPKVWTREDAERWSQAHGGDWEVVQTLWAHQAGANCIRKEIALLIRILRAAKLWGDEEKESFVRLRAVEDDIERALTAQEQHRLLHVGASRLEFRYIYQYVIVALQTTAGPNELRHLRLCDVMLDERIIQVPRAGAKNKYRTRAIPLVTEEASWAIAGLLERARSLGSVDPMHYLFPIQSSRTHYDPTRPMSESGLKDPWDALRRAANLPEMRLYDLRHTGMTRMAEAGVPLPVARSFLGHMTRRMEQRYTAISMAAQRGWGEAVWGAAAGFGPQSVPASAPVYGNRFAVNGAAFMAR